MINLDTNNLVVRYFAWCCDHLPLAVTRDYRVNTTVGVRRNSAYYVENGTTLCHMFWAMLWLPLLGTAFVAVVLLAFGLLHVQMYIEHGGTLGVAAFFMPEEFVLAVLPVMALIRFAIFGASKSDFFKLLWLYLKGIKSRVCPLVRFGGPRT